MTNFKRVRTLQQAYNDPRVEDHSDERGPGNDPGDGIWLYLKYPYKNNVNQTACVHEFNVKELVRVLNEEISEDPDIFRR